MNLFTRTFSIIFIIGVTVLYAVYQNRSLNSNLASSEKETLVTSLPKAKFKDFEGNERSIRELAGDKHVVVHFWATWCGPCATEFPELVKFIQTVDRTNVKFFLIAVNDQKKAVKKFIKTFDKYKDSFVLLFDNSNIHASSFGTVKVPETFVFNKNDNISRKFTGPQDWSHRFYVEFFKQLNE